jgi:hypothetical protein
MHLSFAGDMSNACTVGLTTYAWERSAFQPMHIHLFPTRQSARVAYHSKEKAHVKGFAGLHDDAVIALASRICPSNSGWARQFGRFDGGETASILWLGRMLRVVVLDDDLLKAK